MKLVKNIKTDNDVTIDENLTNSDADFTVPTLEKNNEFPSMADVSIVIDNFGGNELCSTHIRYTLFMNLFNLLTRKKNFKKNDFQNQYILQKIENEYHSKSIVKSQAVQSLLEVFGQIVFENVFLSGLSKKINATKNLLESLSRSITNLPGR